MKKVVLIGLLLQIVLATAMNPKKKESYTLVLQDHTLVSLSPQELKEFPGLEKIFRNSLGKSTLELPLSFEELSYIRVLKTKESEGNLPHHATLVPFLEKTPKAYLLARYFYSAGVLFQTDLLCPIGQIFYKKLISSSKSDFKSTIEEIQRWPSALQKLLNLCTGLEREVQEKAFTNRLPNEEISPPEPLYPTTALALSDDAQLLAISTPDKKTLNIYSLVADSTNILQSIHYHKKINCSPQFDATGNLIAVAVQASQPTPSKKGKEKKINIPHTRRSRVFINDINNQTVVSNFSVLGKVQGITFNKDSSQIAISTALGKIYLYSLGDNHKKITLKEKDEKEEISTRWGRGLAFDSESKTLFFNTNDNIVCLDLSSKKLKDLLVHPKTQYGISGIALGGKVRFYYKADEVIIKTFNFKRALVPGNPTITLQQAPIVSLEGNYLLLHVAQTFPKQEPCHAFLKIDLNNFNKVRNLYKKLSWEQLGALGAKINNRSTVLPKHMIVAWHSLPDEIKKMHSDDTCTSISG